MMWLFTTIYHFLWRGCISEIQRFIHFFRGFLVGLKEALCVSRPFLVVGSLHVSLLEIGICLFLLQKFCGFFDQVRWHLTLVITCHNSWPVVAQTLQIAELERFVNLFGLESIWLFIVFSITVVELVAIDPVRVFESLAIHIDVFFKVSPKTYNIWGIKGWISVYKRLGLKWA